MGSIKTKGTIFVFIILLAFIFVMFPLSHGITTQWMRSSLHENLENSATTIRKFTDDHLLQYIGPLERLANNPEIQSMNWESQREILEQQVTIEYKEMAIVSNEGIAYYTDGTQLDLSDRNYIQRSLAGEFNISEVITSRVTGEKVKMIGYPIHREGEVVGALIARIEPNFLSEFLEEEAGGLYSLYFVLDQEGYPRIHPDSDYLTEELTFFELENEDENLQGLSGFLKDSYAETKGFGSYEVGGKEVIFGYAHFHTLDWILYIGHYGEELNQGIQLLNTIYLVSGIVLIFLLAGVSMFIVKTFADPVLELESQFQKAAQGDLNVRSKILRNDELGRASENFNLMMDKMKSLTYYDPVTKLANQNVFEEQFQKSVHNAGEFRKIEPIKEMSVILVTLKGFSKINERFGYSWGDDVLRELTRRIRVILPESTRIFRGKGDQFILWNPMKKSEEDLMILSERLISKIEWPLEVEEGEIRVKCHIGISQYPKDGGDSESMIKKAAFAGNYSKKLRGEKIRIFDEALYEKEIEDSNLLQEIDRGLAEEEFELYYQPIYRLDTMNIEEIEALIRWNHPREGFISPGKFITIAENSGTIQRIDYYVIEKAIKQIKSWENTACNNLIISVNLSADTFEDPYFESWLLQFVKDQQCDSGKIQLELTERVLLEDVNRVIEKFKRLRENGFKIAIDDFGVGYSSLSYLVKLPIDQLKIDQSFIRNLHKGKAMKAVVSTVVNMGKELNMRVIAEGIEEEDQLQYLRSIDCPAGQGYLLKRPIATKGIEYLF